MDAPTPRLGYAYFLPVFFSSSFGWAATGQATLSDCLIEPWQTSLIGSPVTGVLANVSVQRGSYVKRGQTIALLNSSVEKASVELAEFKAKQEGAMNQADKKVEFARRKWERKQAMASEKLMPVQDGDDAEGELRIAEAELLIAKENHNVALLEFAQQKAQLEQRTIQSPFNGVVLDQQVFPGEVVEPGANAKPILKISQLDPLRVRIILPKSRFGSIKLGQKVSVSPEPPLKGAYTGSVDTVDRVIDAASGTFEVFLELPNPDLKIPAGVKCQAAV